MGISLIFAASSFSFAESSTTKEFVDYVDVQYEMYVNSYEYHHPAPKRNNVAKSSLPLSQYPVGSYYNDFGDEPCTCHYDECNIDGSCDCKEYNGGIQCFGFANEVFSIYNGEECSAANENGELKNITAASLKSYLEDLPVGTHVRYKGSSAPHSFIIIGHTTNGLEVYEANWQPNCKISTRTVTYSTLATQIVSITNSWSA